MVKDMIKHAQNELLILNYPVGEGFLSSELIQKLYASTNWKFKIILDYNSDAIPQLNGISKGMDEDRFEVKINSK